MSVASNRYVAVHCHSINVRRLTLSGIVRSSPLSAHSPHVFHLGHEAKHTGLTKAKHERRNVSKISSLLPIDRSGSLQVAPAAPHDRPTNNEQRWPLDLPPPPPPCGCAVLSPDGTLRMHPTVVGWNASQRPARRGLPTC
jgi:hypothetical protein